MAEFTLLVIVLHSANFVVRVANTIILRFAAAQRRIENRGGGTKAPVKC